jgi:hypothetical protein
MEMPNRALRKTEIDFRLCLRVFGLSLCVFGLSLCGFHLCQNHADHNRQLKCFFISVFPRSLVPQFQTSRSVEQMACDNKSTRVW